MAAGVFVSPRGFGYDARVTAAFIVNPRRAPRAPARCRAAVVSTQGWFEAETEDIGSMGCQLVSPKLVHKGELVKLHVTNAKVEEPLEVAGRVAWVSPQSPWRVGVAFDEAALQQTTRWFELLVSAYPGLGGYRRVPDRIRADSTVYLGPPPKFLLDFNCDEAELLRAIASGARLDELMARLRDRWPAAQRALFSLIARQAVTFQRGHAVHPDSWKKILTDVEASLAIEAMGKSESKVVAPPVPFTPVRPERPAPRAPVHAPDQAGADPAQAGWPAAPHDPTRVVELAEDSGTPLALGTPVPGHAWNPSRVTAPGDFSGAGVGWRAARSRSAEAQAAFDSALEELRGGSTHAAIAFLRRALQLAPGDPEIAAQLGKLAFKDRTPGTT